MVRGRVNPVVLAAGIFVSLVACAPEKQPESVAVADDGPTFVGSELCRNCHSAEYAAWQDSHHALAMQHASESTVLGDFGDASFDHFGTQTRFSRVQDRFVVNTPGADGNARDFHVLYTFGVEPLQQYLVETAGGRLQALPYAWDARDAAAGGQRWYHLYPDEPVLPGDELYWTGAQLNWNYMCAECHSTDVQMNYEADTDRFATSYSEISVGCEACHGPGSRHIAQAQTGSLEGDAGLVLDLDDHGRAVWEMDLATGIARRSLLPMHAPSQPEACGRCHARRGVVAEQYAYGKPLEDTHRVALLEEGLYHADGQILDEVYVYGSFVQSRMYQAGVTCTDCHDAHSAVLKTGDDTNAVCAQCHLPTRFATANHQGEGMQQAACVDCHMPETVYMGIDARRDHSFVVPGRQRAFAAALAAGRDGGANDELAALLADRTQPGIARATALTLLQPPVDREQGIRIVAALEDPDPLLRRAALGALRLLPAEAQLQLAAARLADPVRGVRDEAVRLLAPLRDYLQVAEQISFDAAAAEFRMSRMAMLNRAEAATGLASFEAALGNTDTATRHFERALDISSRYTPARVNYVDMLRAIGDDERGEELLRDGIALTPGDGALHHSLGLLLVRAKKYQAGIDELREAVRLEPGNARYAYVLDVALQSDNAVTNELEPDDK